MGRHCNNTNHHSLLYNSNFVSTQVPAVPVGRSVLGLDRLAAAKRKQQDEERETKKSKISSFRDEDEEDVEDNSDEKDVHKEHKSHKER